MSFWDTSAIVPLLVDEEASAEMRTLLASDPEIVAWWGTPVECASTTARLRREGILSLDDEMSVLTLLAQLRRSWLEVLPSSELRDEAMRLPRIYSLRAADALQLAAAVVWSGRPAQGRLVTLDDRMRLAARIEGFEVLP